MKTITFDLCLFSVMKNPGSVRLACRQRVLSLLVCNNQVTWGKVMTEAQSTTKCLQNTATFVLKYNTNITEDCYSFSPFCSLKCFLKFGVFLWVCFIRTSLYCHCVFLSSRPTCSSSTRLNTRSTFAFNSSTRTVGRWILFLSICSL